MIYRTGKPRKTLLGVHICLSLSHEWFSKRFFRNECFDERHRGEVNDFISLFKPTEQQIIFCMVYMTVRFFGL